MSIRNVKKTAWDCKCMENVNFWSILIMLTYWPINTIKNCTKDIFSNIRKAGLDRNKRKFGYINVRLPLPEYKTKPYYKGSN
jgi:hypothetical protein